MAKKSIRLIPGLGWFMLMSGAVFIDRSNNKSAVASMTQAGEDMKRKKVCIIPPASAGWRFERLRTNTGRSPCGSFQREHGILVPSQNCSRSKRVLSTLPCKVSLLYRTLS